MSPDRGPISSDRPKPKIVEEFRFTLRALQPWNPLYMIRLRLPETNQTVPVNLSAVVDFSG